MSKATQLKTAGKKKSRPETAEIMEKMHVLNRDWWMNRKGPSRVIYDSENDLRKLKRKLTNGKVKQ